jgi:hypothetical protein
MRWAKNEAKKLISKILEATLPGTNIPKLEI